MSAHQAPDKQSSKPPGGTYPTYWLTNQFRWNLLFPVQKEARLIIDVLQLGKLMLGKLSVIEYFPICKGNQLNNKVSSVWWGAIRAKNWRNKLSKMRFSVKTISKQKSSIAGDKQQSWSRQTIEGVAGKWTTYSGARAHARGTRDNNNCKFSLLLTQNFWVKRRQTVSFSPLAQAKAKILFQRLMRRLI